MENHKYGPYIGFVGGLFLTFNGFFRLTCFTSLSSNKYMCWYIHDSNSYVFRLLLISGLITLILGVIALIGVKLVLMDYNLGKHMLLVSGIIATAGIFIPIGRTAMIGILCANSCPIYPVVSMIFIEPFLILIGGILSYFKDFKPINNTIK